MANFESCSAFFPKSDISAEKCMLELATIVSPTICAFISPTETGLTKSIMDATAGVRNFLSYAGLHDYDGQGQGPENKVIIPAYFVAESGLTATKASLYRPLTKHGDPRIWFSGLKTFANAYNLLLLSVLDGSIYVFNLSRRGTWKSIRNHGIVYDILRKAQNRADNVKDELVCLLREINLKGWIPSITRGDPGVGDTLEHALGIQRNNSRMPDFKGIELKATRLTKDGKIRAPTRSTLFTKTPDGGMNYRQILDAYGKVQMPRGGETPRLQLYETFSTTRVNGYDLYLDCDEKREMVQIMHSSSRILSDPHSDFVSSWHYQTLKDAFANKHPETMWVGAESKEINGQEYFKYELAQYTSKPNTAALIDLINNGIITLDLAAHLKTNGCYRDHGMLWKIKPKNLALIVGNVTDVKLTP